MRDFEERANCPKCSDVSKLAHDIAKHLWESGRLAGGITIDEVALIIDGVARDDDQETV